MNDAGEKTGREMGSMAQATSEERAGIGPLIPMSIAFIGIGFSLLVALPFIDEYIGFMVNMGAGAFLILIGVVCGLSAKKKGEFKALKGMMR